MSVWGLVVILMRRFGTDIMFWYIYRMQSEK